MALNASTAEVSVGRDWWVSIQSFLLIASALAAGTAVFFAVTPLTTSGATVLERVILSVALAAVGIVLGLWTTTLRVELSLAGVTCVGVLRRDQFRWEGVRPPSPVLRPGGSYVLRGRRVDGSPSRAWFLSMRQARAIQRWPADHPRPA
jgi:hypothetical protein